MQEKSENFTKIIDRLKYYIDIQGYNFNQLSLKIGVSNSYFSKMYKSKGDLGEDIIRKILLYYENINPEWLLVGEGKMLKSDIIEVKKHLIPLYDDVVTIGGNQVVANMDGASNPSEYIDTGDWFTDATAAIRHYCDSMIEYPSGCILALKEVKDRSLLVFGKNYVIETSEYRITKRLQKGTGDTLIAYSTNTETYPDGNLMHEPIPVPLVAITRIFLVLGYVVKQSGGTLLFSNK